MWAAYAEVPSVILEGMNELDVCRRVKRLFLENGVDDTSYVICRSGQNSYSDIIGHATGRTLQAGDMLIIDAGCQIDGYYCDFNRNFAVGPASTEASEAHARVQEALDAGLKVIKPGTRFKDIYGAMAASMGLSSEAEGGVGRMGHSVGLQLTEWPSVHPAEITMLEEGMVISVEPSIALPSGGGKFIAVEEEVVVTDSGYRLLSTRAAPGIPELNNNTRTCEGRLPELNETWTCEW